MHKWILLSMFAAIMFSGKVFAGKGEVPLFKLGMHFTEPHTANCGVAIADTTTCCGVRDPGSVKCIPNKRKDSLNENPSALKYENIHLSDYKTLPQLRLGVQSYVNFYNAIRLHSAVGYRTPDEVYGQSCRTKIKPYSKSEL